MSDILGIISRSLIPDILIEHSSDLPIGDSAQFDWSSTLPAPSQAPILAPASAKMITADPLAQWLEQTLGISAQFAPPETDQMPESDAWPDALMATALPHNAPVDEQTLNSPALMQNIPVQTIAVSPLLPAETTAEMAEVPVQDAQIHKKDTMQHPSLLQTAPDDATVLQISVAMPVNQDGMPAPVASPLQPIKAKAQVITGIATASTASTASTDAALINIPAQAVTAPETVLHPDTELNTRTVIFDQPTTQSKPNKSAVKQPPAAELMQDMPASVPLVRPNAETEKQTPVAQLIRTESTPALAQQNPLPDAMARPDLPLDVKTTRDFVSPTPVQHAPIPHADPRPVMQQVTSAMVTTREDATEIALAPEELGRIRLVMSGPDRSHVTIWAERPETLDLVRRNADMLTRHLQEAGIDPKNLDFRQDSGRSWQNTTPDQMGHADHDSGGLATTTLVQLTPTPVRDRRVDIRL